MKLIDILEGRNNYLKKTPIPKERIEAVRSCKNNIKAPISFLDVKDDIEEISGRICSECYCPLPYKLRVPDAKCPCWDK